MGHPHFFSKNLRKMLAILIIKGSLVYLNLDENRNFAEMILGLVKVGDLFYLR